MRRLLVVTILATICAARPAAAAEVAIVAMTDPWSTAIDVFDVRTAPPFGALGPYTRPPYHPGRLHRGLALPGNVVAFRLALHLRWEPRPQEYWVKCSPSPLDQAVVMVFAGEMPGSGALPFAAMGRFVGQMGHCHVQRLDR